MIAKATGYSEQAMQPFPAMETLRQQSGFFFRPGCRLAVEVYDDPRAGTVDGPGLLTVGKEKRVSGGGDCVGGERV